MLFRGVSSTFYIPMFSPQTAKPATSIAPWIGFGAMLEHWSYLDLVTRFEHSENRRRVNGPGQGRLPQHFAKTKQEQSTC